MTSPIDVLLRTIHGNINRSTRGLAEAVAESLVHNQIVATAVEALKADGWQLSDDNGEEILSETNLRDIATIVLRSVGGA